MKRTSDEKGTANFKVVSGLIDAYAKNDDYVRPALGFDMRQ
jgi:hypothetical protein